MVVTTQVSNLRGNKAPGAGYSSRAATRMSYETFCKKKLADVLTLCAGSPETARSLNYQTAIYLRKYLRGQEYNVDCLETEAGRHRTENERGERGTEELFEQVRREYKRILAVLENHILAIESIRAVTRPAIAPVYRYRDIDFESEYRIELHSIANTLPYLAKSGLEMSAENVHYNASNGLFVQIRHGESNINFEILNIVAKAKNKAAAHTNWSGIRTILCVRRCNVSDQEEKGITRDSFLKIIDYIAKANYCEMIVDLESEKEGTDRKTLKAMCEQSKFAVKKDEGYPKYAVKNLLGERDHGGQRVYRGIMGASRGDSGLGNIVLLNGMRVPLGLEVQNFSPKGFRWGYRGSGSLQLAVALTKEVYGQGQMWEEGGHPTQELLAIHKLIRELPQENWKLTEEEIREYVNYSRGTVTKTAAY